MADTENLNYQTGLPPGERSVKAGTGGSGYIPLGWILLFAGLATALYFLIGYDISIAPSSEPGLGASLGITPDRVNNLGLMSIRDNAIRISVGTAVIGAILVVAGKVEVLTDRLRR